MATDLGMSTQGKSSDSKAHLVQWGRCDGSTFMRVVGKSISSTPPKNFHAREEHSLKLMRKRNLKIPSNPSYNEPGL